MKSEKIGGANRQTIPDLRILAEKIFNLPSKTHLSRKYLKSVNFNFSKMKTYKYEMEIVIDEKILLKKYPNFHFNHKDTKQFADSTAFAKAENELQKFGFSVQIKQK